MADSNASYVASYQTQAAAERYEKQIYHPEGFDARLWRAEQAIFLRLLNGYIPRLSEAQALDFACGTGRILKFLRPLVKNLIGVDISQAMLDSAAAKVSDTQLVCMNILQTPERLPQNLDLITAFRFVLLAEPELRVNCIRQLTRQLRPETGRMIINTHGNPHSFRCLASLRNRLFRRGAAPIPAFSIKDMRDLAGQCGLQIIAVGGAGFIPRSITMILPAPLTVSIEKMLSRIPWAWRWATNIIFVMKVP